jgi:acyl-CoA synthetase (AMP-forming)/AMP-acid ligase II
VDDPTVDERLLGPGGPFELTTEPVGGVEMTVFRQRHRSLGELLDASAAHGDADFLVFDGGPRLTFTQHRRLAAGVARSLRERHGIGPGDRVAVAAANGPGWVLTAAACAELGAVLVALNSWWTADELRAALDLTDPAVVVADAPRRALLGGDRPVIAAEAVLDDLAGGGTEPGPPAPVAEDDPALLLFTSGTTGRPKAAVLSHRSVIGFVQLTSLIGARTALARPAAAGPRPPTVRLAVFPLFHVSGYGSHLGALAWGLKTVWPAGAFDPGRVLELTRQEGITVWNGASTHLIRLLDHPAIDSVDPRQLQQVGIGGSATTPSLIARTAARFSHLVGTFGSGYGLTESGGLVSHATNEELRAAPDCVGAPLPTVEVRIVDGDGHPVPDGVPGTICVRSPILMSGWWKGEALPDDRWLRTEDFGRLEGGRLHIASRIRDLIIRGGENVYPVEVEDCLDGHPDVVESAVYGRDDETYGQVVHAAVHLRPGAGATPGDLRRHCADRLAYYKVPDEVHLHPDPLPRNAAGKLLKTALRDGTP